MKNAQPTHYKEVKDLNMFSKDKINKMIKKYNPNMHAMSDFEDLSISSSNKNIQSIISNTSVEGSDNKSCKLASKKWGHGQKQTMGNLRDNKNIAHIDDAINPCLTFLKLLIS